MASATVTPPPLDDLSATPSTSDTTDTTIKLSHASSPRRLLKGTSAAAKMIGSAIGLPGVFEVGQIAGRLAHQTPNQHHAEVADLGAHLQGMLHIADPDHSLLERQQVELSRDLESVHCQVNDMQRSDRSLSAIRARKRVEELEELPKQTDRLADRQILIHLRMQDLVTQAQNADMNSQLESIVEATSQTQKLLISSLRVPAPESDDFPEDKVLAIDLDSIECQEVEQSYTVMKEQPSFIHGSAMCALTHPDGMVRVTCTTGLLNGVRVMRKSYNSPNRATATQLAKNDLILLSKFTHPNIARLKGVARDMYDQIRDIVVTTAPMTQQGFLESVGDPRAITRYMQGMLEIHMLESMTTQSSWWPGGEVQIQVNYDGHITAIPAAGVVQSSWDRFTPWNTKLSPAAKDILEILYNQYTRSNDPHNPLGLRRFIYGVSHLQPGFTPLDVLKVAVGATLAPSTTFRVILESELPLATFSVGDIVIMENERCVRVLENRFRQIMPTYSERSMLTGDSSDIGGWSSFVTLTLVYASVGWEEALELEPWEVFRTKAEQISQSHSTALHQLCQSEHLCEWKTNTLDTELAVS
ncbi:hypothetical protein FRC12_023765 [Ceratobasidium sp. 428]|nr:hypothetical protein FRC12_023765 [Ceratobasidium sp. 428]